MAWPPECCRSNPRFVGDPIDVVTGANVDFGVDLLQRGPIDFRWASYYSSARCHVAGSLGWGRSHDFDCILVRDLDGLRYESPAGAVIGFPELRPGGSAFVAGIALTRTAEHSYAVAPWGQPVQEYHFGDDVDAVRLARLRRGSHVIELRYGPGGRLREIIDSRGRRIQVISDEAGRVLQLRLMEAAHGPREKVLLTYEYDAAGNLIKTTDLYSTSLTYAYDAHHRLTRRTDRRGYSFHFRYDDQGRCIHSRGDDGLFEVFLDYELDARTTFVRRGDGGQWIYFYDENNAITQITDPHGNATKFILDDRGRTIEEIDPNGNAAKLHYSSIGVHDYIISPTGQIQPTRDENPDPPNPLAYHLPRTPLEWEFGRLIERESINPPHAHDRVLLQFPAEVFNAVLSIATGTSASRAEVPPTEVATDDDFGRPVERTTRSFTERWKYDANGNEIEHQDRDGAVWRRTYQSWNALAETIDPLGHATIFQQNVQGLVSKVTDPGGTITEYAYDLKDKLVEVRRHGRLRESYVRDAAGIIIARRDTQGHTLVRWEVGPGNLPKARILASGERHEFEHDKQGRIVSAQAPAGLMTFAYDSHGHVVADLRDGVGVVHEFEFGQLVTTVYFGKFKVLYQTNDVGDVLVTDPRGGCHTFQRSACGLIAKKLATGDVELCQYDVAGRCVRKALTCAGGRGLPWMRTCSYSSAGDLLSIDDTEGGVTTYAYDGAHRLAKEVLRDGTSRRFAFDAAGNLHAQPGLTNVVVDKGNRIVGANGDRFSYDGRDHLCVRTVVCGTTRYEFNSLDLLVGADIDGAKWTAAYDVYCRRVEKTWLGRTTRYYWDDFRLAAEVKHDGALRIYVYVDDVALVPFMYVDYPDLEAEPATGEPYYLFTNHIGVPIRVEDTQGRRRWSARIEPYGLADIADDAALEMPLRFPGHYFDSETGLHYNRFRYFCPELGRYLQSDPVGLYGGINVYAYRDCPLTFVDIDGLANGTTRSGPAGEGTAGAGACCPIVPINPKTGKPDLALQAARQEAARQRAEHGDDAPQCTAAVRDKTTGKIYVATSGDPPLKQSEAHPDLGMPTDLKSKEPWPPGNCAEPKAINAALNDGAKKEDLQVASVNTDDGTPKQCCRNCTQTTRGTTVSPATSKAGELTQGS